MTDRTREVDQLDTRLSEIDRKLGEIQAELAPPGDEAAAGAVPGLADADADADAPEDPLASGSPSRGRSGPLEGVLLRAPRQRAKDDLLARRIAELASLQSELLGSLREVLGAFQRGLGPVGPSPVGELTVSAGPFRTTDELRAFESALSALPGVRMAAVRGYEGADRAVIDVELDA